MNQLRGAAGPTGILTFPKRCLDYVRDPLGYLTHLARAYGDLVELPSPGVRMYLVSHPDQIDEILRGKHRLFQRYWHTESTRPLFGRGMLTSDGDEWQRQRTTAQPQFRTARLHEYAATMVEATERRLAGWKRDEARDFHADMTALTLEIATKTLFDVDVSADAAQVGRDLDTLMEFYATPYSIWPTWIKFPTPGNLRVKAALRRFEGVVYQMMRERRVVGTEGRSDYLSQLLVAEDDHGRKLGDSEIRDALVTMIIAGHLTTAGSLTFAFHLLSQNPDVEATLLEEIDGVLGRRTPTVEDIPGLRYTDWVVKESMRMCPPVWLFGRAAVEDVQIGPYLIPKGVQVLFSPWVVQRDPRFWPEPERFRPSRWGEPAIDDLPQCAYFPFGDGPRTCLGKAFGMIEVVLLLATILQRYRLELAPGERLRLLPSLMMRARGGLKMIPRERSTMSRTAESTQTEALLAETATAPPK